MTLNPSRTDEPEEFLKLSQASEPSLRHNARSRTSVHEDSHGREFLRSGSGQLQNLLYHCYCPIGESFLAHFCLHAFQTNLVQLVNCDGDVYDLIRKTADFSEARQHFPIVNLDENIYVQQAENLIDYLNQFKLIHLRLGANHVHVTLAELTIAPFLRPVRPPHRLQLEPFEWKRNLALVLHHITSERHREVISQPFFAHCLGKRSTVHRARNLVDIFIEIDSAEGIPAIQHPEKQFVALVPVLP